MSEFLELLETLRAEDATNRARFSTDSLYADVGGMRRRIRGTRRDNPRYQRALLEAAELVAGVYDGRVPTYRLEEAMSTSDFPLLFGDILDRQMLAAYEEWPTQWRSTAKRATVRDFRLVARHTTDGTEGILPKVPQGSEYTEAAITEGRYTYRVDKYGRRVPYLWETIINDDLDALREQPNKLAKAARMSEDRFWTELFVDATGPDPTFFSAGNLNRIITGGVGLTVDKLQTAFTLIRTKVDADGNPIFTGRLRLVVPPQLEVTARNIMNATEIRESPGATSGQQITTTNWMSREVVEVVVAPWLPIVDVSANKATTWYLFADPGIGRPAMELGFLRGNETPALFMKSPNAVRVGGGLVGAEEGSFETDGVDYKVRHVFGGTLLDPKAGVAYIGA